MVVDASYDDAVGALPGGPIEYLGAVARGVELTTGR